jgi:hypothetical protein
MEVVLWRMRARTAASCGGSLQPGACGWCLPAQQTSLLRSAVCLHLTVPLLVAVVAASCHLAARCHDWCVPCSSLWAGSERRAPC